MPRFQIDLPDETYNTLAAMALEELRQTPQQAAWVLIRAMQEREDKRANPSPRFLPGSTYAEGRCRLGMLGADATAEE